MKNTSASTSPNPESVATINLPAGLTRIRLLQIPQLIALALYPFEEQAIDRENAERWATNEIFVDAASGTLPMRNPFTLGQIEPELCKNHLLADSVVNHAVITVADLRAYLALRDLSVLIQANVPVKTTCAESTQNATARVDFSLLADPPELLGAFSAWGLKEEWFADLRSHKWLLEARKVVGRGQRGSRLKPLFCPYQVMQGMMLNVRRSKRLNSGTAWRILELKFPRVYGNFENYDPRKLTGD